MTHLLEPPLIKDKVKVVSCFTFSVWSPRSVVRRSAAGQAVGLLGSLCGAAALGSLELESFELSGSPDCSVELDVEVLDVLGSDSAGREKG
ncbi:MAG TPA: hypothetical protein VFP89_13775 [Propionibacteriaceae bacterium]|nr:hypothetical protein [Propionibacteriaceae bacterium]